MKNRSVETLNIQNAIGRINWKREADILYKYLNKLSIRDEHGVELPPDKGFSIWREWGLEMRKNKKVCYFVGNGASASIASHMAADLAKNSMVHTQVFSDLALITALGNDIGYDSVYSVPLSARGEPGDMLVCISSSGKSRNILKVVDTAKKLNMRVITVSAMDPLNPLRKEGNLSLYVPAADYGHAESLHTAILHFWMDLVAEASELIYDAPKAI